VGVFGGIHFLGKVVVGSPGAQMGSPGARMGSPGVRRRKVSLKPPPLNRPPKASPGAFPFAV